MKKQMLIFLVPLIFLTVLGCVAGKVKFNEQYMPDAVPNQPKIKISFSDSVNGEIAKYNRKAKFANNIELCWLAADRLYLHLENADVYRINEGGNEVVKLPIDERREIVGQINKKVNITNTAENSGLAKKVVSYVLSSFGQEYTGEIVDNSITLQVFVETEIQRGDNPTEKSCDSASLKGKLTNNRGKEMQMKWPFQCDWLPQPIANDKVPQILRRLNIAPSGRHILYGSRLYRFGAGKMEADLLSNYPDVTAVAVKPDWTRIAVLRGSFGKYWVEIFNLTNLD